MLNTIWWLLTAEAVGLVAFPLAYSLFPALKDRGYCVTRPLGILVLGYATWILSVLHIIPCVRPTIAGLLLLMGALSGWYAWRRRQELKDFFAREGKTVLMMEGVFLVFFLGWALYRAYDPFIDHTEEPMDMMFLNAAVRSRAGVPEDLWLRGEPVSYYYFGYWMMGVLTELTGIMPSVAYNLSLALIPAMAAAGIFGLVCNMVRADRARLPYAVVAGLAATVLLVVVANLEGVLEFMRANAMGPQGLYDWVRIDGLDGPSQTPTQTWRPQEFWWWFRATRVINTFQGETGVDYTIQEFPFFSFMLGDLHPHVMSIPFGILFLVICLNFFWSEEGAQQRVHRYVYLAVTGLALGGLAFVNMWDLPTYAALFVGVAAIRAYRRRDGDIWTLAREAAPASALVIALAGLLFLPYYLQFRAGVQGIGTVETATRPVHIFIVWAVLLAAVAPMAIAAFCQTIVKPDWRRLSAIGLAVGFLPFVAWAFLHLLTGGTNDLLAGRLFHVLPFALLIGIATYSALWLARHQEDTGGKAFALLLAALGLLLIMGPDLMYVNDGFGPPSERMNTVFKLYYQAWVLLSAAGGFAVYYWASLRWALPRRAKVWTSLWAAVFVALLAGALYYPPAAAASKAENSSQGPTLDGLAFLSGARQAEYEAIRFLRRTAGPDSAIVEAVGEWFDWGLISRGAGMPTILNWPGHEVQWRGSSAPFEDREADVARIYQTLDPEEAKTLLAKYDVDYVYVGPREREKYGVEGLDKFTAFMDEVFRQGDVVIYRLRQ